MSKKLKLSLLVTITSLICLSTIAVFSATSANSLDAEEGYYYTILDDGSFEETITQDGHDYILKCFRIQDNENSIAVAWGQDASSIPSAFELPSTISSDKPTGSAESYNVVAIAYAGFMHCTFTSIVVPQSVKDIRAEAFAYCQNLESFQFPKDVKTIAPSAFLDCRSLVSVYYSESDGRRSTSNSTITSIQNHAFDSCVLLRRIECPYSATFFGESCFQKCSSLTKFKFPSDNKLEGDNRNTITVEPYAFADCAVLRKVYFDVNMKIISDYAFADSRNDLTFYFYGDKDEDIPNTFESKWRNKKITTDASYINVVYDILDNQVEEIDGGYPGLTCALWGDTAVKLNNARTNDSINIIDAVGPEGRKYAAITGFEVPDSTDWEEDYYDDGVLTIPDVISYKGTDYTVKVIADSAFEDKPELTQVIFNEHLVQIQHHAFFHSNNISLFDFDKCTDLREISYCIFNEMRLKSTATGTIDSAVNTDIDYNATVANDNLNKVMTNITLPNCLQYLGNFAFYNFTNLTGGISFKTDPDSPSQLRLIGDYAFSICSGTSNNQDKVYFVNGVGANTDLVLPYSLSDEYAREANIFHSFTYDNLPAGKTTVNETIYNRVAVNKNAFENQDSIRTVTMEKGGEPHDISFGSNIFVRCSNLLRFESTENICLIGTDCFKSCTSIREVFLHADRAYNNTSGWDDSGPTNEKVNDPWGVSDGDNNWLHAIFNKNNSTTYLETVFYVKSSTSPSKYPNGGKVWYESDTKYTNDMTGNTRSTLPVYYMDWTVNGNIKYWHKNKTLDEIKSFDDGPRTLDAYKNGYIAFCKNGATTYTATRYYSDATPANISETIDLTSSTLTSASINVSKIGAEAFCNNSLGYYFILPSTVTEIQERAFMRSNGKGVRIVTFKNGGTVQVYSGGTTFEAARSLGASGGYCCLPTSVTTINSNAFYNNSFKYVEIGTGVSKIYESAFYSHAKSSSEIYGKTTSFAFTDYGSGSTNTSFTVINDGIYYTKDVTAQNKGKNKVLFQQSQGITGSLTIDDDTMAVWYYAAASSQYDEVDFNDAYMIYGRAFKNCYKLVTLTNTSSLKYICWTSGVPAAEIPSVNGNIAATDNTTNDGAFENCSSLHVDFSTFTNIVKIGANSFKGCTNIVNWSIPKDYKFYTYTSGGSETNIVANDGFTTKVLDLSTLTTFRSIGKGAFDNCSINYVILPNTTGTNYTSVSEFECTGGNPFSGIGGKVLFGETVKQADPNHADVTNISKAQSKAHYYTPGSSDYANLYYRTHSTSDVDTGIATNRRYWTAVTTGDADEVHIILFDSPAAANDWYNQGHATGRQLDTFPEP